MMMTTLIAMTVCVSQEQPIDTHTAARYFKEAESVSARDGGALWGMPLYGPMIFIDPGSRSVVANQPDKDGLLSSREGLYVGHWPASKPFANTAIEWGGVHWTMIIWPLPQERAERATLMMHECFHRIQAALNLPGGDPASDHLDTLDGRILLRLELRALRRAVLKQGDERTRAIADALLFREHRRHRFPGAAQKESALEWSEGIAEYTGIRLTGSNSTERARLAAAGLERIEGVRSFVRSFAYATGPAYGLLLDDIAGNWREGLTTSADLGHLLAKAASATLPNEMDQAVEVRAKAYGGDEIRNAEVERDREHQALLAKYRKQFIEGPVLILPLLSADLSFDPRTLVPLGDHGAVYPTFTLSDEWGTLSVTGGGALRSADWSGTRVSITEPLDKPPYKGEGWSLKLNQGWIIKPAERKGDLVVTKGK